MFISDPLVFVELHKTAGSHIGRCLNDILNGHQEGKHNVVPPELYDRFILGSIRNPWDWYVSLWGFGCDGNGSVYHQVTRRFGWAYYWRQLNKEMGRTWLSPSQYLTQVMSDASKPVSQWQDAYRDSSDPDCFRSWLKLILSAERRYDLGEGYGFSPISQHSGVLTYRFFKLFTRLRHQLYQSPTLEKPKHLNAVWKKERLTQFIVRNEALEEDLIEALQRAGVTLTEQDRQFIRQGKSQKTNVSTRRTMDHYYDEETIALVAQRESFIVEQFNYQPPTPA
ncbi:hypothetical protein [Marinimicrobium sp. ARAG 43.8]|uniref:hypothetical protein n=1 Tax=Marinimicrobium sp. ARAG 43.8 TaxID=3418719 RepID=UPI003CFACCEC